MKQLKTVYWKIVEIRQTNWLIAYWTKPDGSNSIKRTMRILTEDSVRRAIADDTGLKDFHLVQMDGA